MSNDEARPVSPEPARAPGPGSPTVDPSPVAGPQPQSAFVYPDSSEPARPRSRGKRLALLISGAVVVALLIFGGGFWTGSAVNSIPAPSHSRFGDDPRMGPGGPGDPRQPGRDDEDSDSDSDTDSTTPESTDPSIFEG
ncbi:MAG: hypothetical protein ABWZ69_05740 [Mycetocola sp.]